MRYTKNIKITKTIDVAALREIKSKEQDFDIVAQDSGLISEGRFSKLDLTNKREQRRINHESDFYNPESLHPLTHFICW